MNKTNEKEMKSDKKQDFVVSTSKPNKELLESLQEIEDYKNGKVELDSFKDIQTLRKTLVDEKE